MLLIEQPKNGDGVVPQDALGTPIYASQGKNQVRVQAKNIKIKNKGSGLDECGPSAQWGPVPTAVPPGPCTVSSKKPQLSGTQPSSRHTWPALTKKQVSIKTETHSIDGETSGIRGEPMSIRKHRVGDGMEAWRSMKTWRWAA